MKYVYEVKVVVYLFFELLCFDIMIFNVVLSVSFMLVLSVNLRVRFLMMILSVILSFVFSEIFMERLIMR